MAAPSEQYDVPLWCEPKVARDHRAQVAKALYSLPTRLIGKTLRARADRSLVRFYDGDELVKTHAWQPPGGRAIDSEDFPSEKRAYALRDIDYLAKQARTHGEHVGRFAKALLDGPLPWTRMRRVYALLSLAQRYGDARLDSICSALVALYSKLPGVDCLIHVGREGRAENERLLGCLGFFSESGLRGRCVARPGMALLGCCHGG